ncbi:MAG: type I-C CRISPR-associated protein Cas5c [Bilifractor sp.]|jgi:CRISPR-associated protein Cas5d
MRKIRVMVTGKRACFTRPEMKAERVSYDVPTPGALEGMFKSIYWKPAMEYKIDRIVVFNPIQFETVRRNEVKSKVKFSKMKSQMQEAQRLAKRDGDLIRTNPRIYTSEGDERTQRSSMILKNVRYGVEFHIELTGLRSERESVECNPQVKHEEEFCRRCRKGQYFRQPCLGCAEFPAQIKLVDDFPVTEIDPANMGEHDLGFMLYKVAFKDQGHPINDDWKKNIYSDEADSLFYRPSMIDGIIDVTKYREMMKC